MKEEAKEIIDNIEPIIDSITIMLNDMDGLSLKTYTIYRDGTIDVG